MPASNPFDDALDKISGPDNLDASIGESKQRRWEHRVVRELLTYYDLGRYAKMMTDIARGQTGAGVLTFQAFKQLQPTFPVWLGCRKVPYVHKDEIGDYARRFPKTRLFKAFTDAEAEAPEAFQAGRCGLVFEWLHVWATAIIHNHYHAVQSKELVLFYNWVNTDPPQLFAIQSFSSFLESLRWTPQ